MLFTITLYFMLNNSNIFLYFSKDTGAISTSNDSTGTRAEFQMSNLIYFN